MTVTTIEFVEHEVDGGVEEVFGKVVARCDVTGMPEALVALEIAEMHELVAAHCVVRFVETVPSCG